MKNKKIINIYNINNILKINKNSKRIIFLAYICFLLFLLLYSVEIFLFNFNKSKKSKELFILYNQLYKNNKIEPTFYNIGGNAYQWHKEAESEYLNNGNLLIPPYSGLSNMHTIFCKEGYDYSVYKSDEYGFNNKNFVNGDYTNKRFKFLFIGDSFTHGACVSDESNIPAVVNNNIKNNNLKLEDNYVLNLGFSGTGPLTQYGIFREFIHHVKTDALVWLYFEGNDLDDLDLELNNQSLKKYISNTSFDYNFFNSKKSIDQYLLNKHKKTVDFLKKENNFNIKTFLTLRKTRGFILHNILEVVRKPNKQNINLARYKQLIIEHENILKHTKILLEDKNIKFYFIYIPSYISFLDMETKNLFLKNSNFNATLINNNYFRDDIIKILQNLDIQYIDFYKEMTSRSNDPLNYFPERKINHFNEQGYQFIADFIFNKFH